MDSIQFVIIIALLVVLAETTYLIANSPRQFSVRRQVRPILLDTSVLIDGRIISVAKTGFISGTLIIPRSVLGELQFLADNGDHDKRSRARYGLDIVSELQALAETDVQILQDGNKADEGVDNRLLALAKKHGAAICTIDYNLNKVAIVEGISVLNVNELAQGLRMAYLPGEKMHLELVQKGQDAHQAVGYLPDGTMVVVEHASKLIGKSIEVEIIRSLQTAAGRMMFAKKLEPNGHIQTPPPPQKPDTRPNEPSQERSGRNAGRSNSQSAPKPNSPNRQNTPRSLSQNTTTSRTSGRRRGPIDAESKLINMIENTSK